MLMPQKEALQLQLAEDGEAPLKINKKSYFKNY